MERKALASRLLLPVRGLSQQERQTLGTAKEEYGRAWNIAWPAMIELIMISLAATIDTAMVATLGDAAVAAVSYSVQPRLLCLALIKSLNVGVTAVVARRLGERNLDGASGCMRQAIVISALISVLSCGAFFLAAAPTLRLCGSMPDTLQDATAYFRWMLPGQALQQIYMTINIGQSCSGNGRLSMKTNMTACVIHILFNYLLIGGHWGFPAMGLRGAALAGVLGNLAALLVAVESLLNPKSVYTVKTRRGWLPTSRNVHLFWKVGGSALLENLCFRLGIFVCALIAAHLGTLLFAANSICMSLTDTLLAGVEGFAVAAAALVGRELGAGHKGRAEMVAKLCFGMAVVFGLGMIAVMVGLRGPLLGIFSSDPLVLQSGRFVMLIVAAATIPDVFMIVYAGALRGAGDTKFVARFSLFSAMIVRPSLAWLLTVQLEMGLNGLWYALLADFALRGGLNFLRFSSGKWKTIQV